MLTIHGTKDNTPEHRAALWLGQIACDYDREIENSKQVVLEIFPSVQCFGQKTQDIDLLVFFADYRPTKETFTTKDGRTVHSFCATIEIKGHSPEDVIFDGAQCSVLYNGERHDVTAQSEKQKHSVKKYIEKNPQTPKAPWIINMILFTRVHSAGLPKGDSNILGMDAAWQDVIETAAMLAGSDADGIVKTFSSRFWLEKVKSIFSKRIQASKIDRKRLEAITKNVLDRTKQQYAEKLGKQLLIYRGRGGTGKTVRLIRTAYQAYDELGLRVLLLTYNKALVADLRRLLVLAGVRDVVGDGSIAIKTIHSFMYQWLLALDIIEKNESNFLGQYEEKKREALELLRGGAISSADLEAARAGVSRDLTWDLVLIDESQDWPATERDLIYHLYGREKVIIADGVDQFVRGVTRIDWREGMSKSESQIINLTKSLRLKSSLCQTVSHFAEEIEFDNWNLEPLPEAQGGKVVVIVGNALSEEFHRRLAATARSDGNRPIDMLMCVPPTWVEKVKAEDESQENRKESIVAREFKSWGYEVWDAVDPVLRDEFPTSLDQFRIVQYESCRGLEGWVVVCFGLDEFFDYKRSNADISESAKADIFYEEEAAAFDYAKRWLMIPLTRAIDTLVIHINSESSYIGGVLSELHRKYPHDVEWIEYK